MENAVKALEMAAGVLLGVILMAAVAYFFTQISSWPEREDEVVSSEQLAKFNQEYEVYNKSKMYGVDVLSCLNKVISNNTSKEISKPEEKKKIIVSNNNPTFFI